MNGKVKMWTREHKRWLSQFQRCTCVLGVWAVLTGWALSPPWIPKASSTQGSWTLMAALRKYIWKSSSVPHCGQSKLIPAQEEQRGTTGDGSRASLSAMSFPGGLAACPCFSFHLTPLKMARCRAQPWGMLVVLFWLALSSCFQNSQFVTKENEQCPLKQFEVCHDGL